MTASVMRAARHVHLQRAAVLAGEAFGPLAEDAVPARRPGYAVMAWAVIALATVGAVLLLV